MKSASIDRTAALKNERSSRINESRRDRALTLQLPGFDVDSPSALHRTDHRRSDERAAGFYARHLFMPLLAVLLLAWMFDLTQLDWRVSNWFFDPVAMRFPLRDNPFLEIGLHHIVKYVVVTFAIAMAALTMASFLKPQWRRYRPILIFLVLSLGLSSAAVSELKTLTGHHCPYELAAYGGDMPFFGVFDARPKGVPAGRCWPGGHASTAFCLFGLYFALRWTGRRQMANQILLGILLLGAVLGMGRVAQGAHFVSHNLWSAVICWLLSLGLYELLLRRRKFGRFP